jgi:hypothetical protein
MGSIHEKNQMPKISCYCTFNVHQSSFFFVCSAESTNTGGFLMWPLECGIINKLRGTLARKSITFNQQKTSKAEKNFFCWFESEGKILETGKWQL